MNNEEKNNMVDIDGQRLPVQKEVKDYLPKIFGIIDYHRSITYTDMSEEGNRVTPPVQDQEIKKEREWKGKSQQRLKNECYKGDEPNTARRRKRYSLPIWVKMIQEKRENPR